MQPDPVIPGSLPTTRFPPFNGDGSAHINLQERKVPSVPPPTTKKPTDEEFFLHLPNQPLQPDPMFLREHFLHEGRLTETQALLILEQTTAILKREPNMIEVRSPVTICGDIHGQYYDLMKLFEVGGNPKNDTYLFLGDYVDRGSFGIECLLFLYALKIAHPTKFVLLRGNHECRHLTEYFTFKRECLHKYTPRVYEACIDSFNSLPIAARVDKHFFCVHGGISPELNTLDDLRNLHRFQEPGSHGLLCDLLWSDPVPNFGYESESTPNQPALLPGTMFLHNQTRGCSFNFTYEAACRFLDRNDLLGIIRGHEAQDAGYTMHRKTPSNKFPSVITIFSAPNYLDVYHNRGAVLKYNNKNVTIRQYNSSPHPYWLPNFMDGFTWSLPFVGAKITEMLLAILSICSEEELGESDSDSEDDNKALADAAMSPADYAARKQQIKNKILAVGRMQRVFQLLREEAEASSELTANDADASGMDTGLGPDALGVNGSQISRGIHSFEDARRSDMMNERLPHFQPGAMAPSMRRRGSINGADGDEGLNMDYLIKKTLEEDGDDGGAVEQLADRIARGQRRPQGLKRYGTA